METGRVRAILVRHFGLLHPGTVPAVAGDPNRLVESWALAQAMRSVAALRGDPALRHAGADYVALWARTFRTLSRHLRGRPERAISLFAEELYPFLRGDRLAARVESAQPGRATLLLSDDLPEGYLAGLVQAFVELSGARATVSAAGGRIQVTYRIAPSHRLARAAQELANLRIPLVVAVALSCTLGVAMAVRDGATDFVRAGIVVVGGVAAQLGANAWHDLRHAHPSGPLRLLAPSRRRLLWQARLGFAAAGVLGLHLAVDAPIVIAFAAAGLLVSLLFGHFRSQGWGPVLVALTYGPLVVGGAYHAFMPLDLEWAGLASRLLPSMALGLSAAALIHVDDLADRPLDEAGGQRTLAVRLPQRRQALVYALLALGAVFASALPVLSESAWLAAAQTASAVTLAGWLAIVVHGNLDNPAGLGTARLGTLALHAGLATAVTLAVHPVAGAGLVALLLIFGFVIAARGLSAAETP